MNGQRITIVLIIIVLMLSSIFCSFMEKDEPAIAAEEFFIAVNTLDILKADGLVCKDERDSFREDLENGATWLTAFEFLIGPIDIEVDTSEVEFSTINQQDDWAIVKATGEVRNLAGGSIGSDELDETWFLKFEEDEWRWCGESEQVTGIDEAGTIRISGESVDYEKIQLAIKNIVSLRVEGEDLVKQFKVEGINDEERTIIEQQYEGVVESPNEAHVTILSGGNKTEIIQKSNTKCMRHNNQPWSCGEYTNYWSNFEFSELVDSFERILVGNPPEEKLNVVEHGSKTGMLYGEECLIFFLVTTREDKEGRQEKLSEQVCFDPTTFYPLIKEHKSEETFQGEILSIQNNINRIFDINKPVDITLPVP